MADCTHDHATITKRYTLTITHTPGKKPVEQRVPQQEIDYSCPDCGARGTGHGGSLPRWAAERLATLPA